MAQHHHGAAALQVIVVPTWCTYVLHPEEPQHQAGLLLVVVHLVAV
jgi:hypothetical protein